MHFEYEARCKNITRHGPVKYESLDFFHTKVAIAPALSKGRKARRSGGGSVAAVALGLVPPPAVLVPPQADLPRIPREKKASRQERQES